MAKFLSFSRGPVYSLLDGIAFHSEAGRAAFRMCGHVYYANFLPEVRHRLIQFELLH